MTFQTLPHHFGTPRNWESGDFTNPETGHTIHFQYGMPETPAKGTVVALPGLSEFGEKYYETAQFFINQGYGFCVIDWAYQGRSSRFHKNPHKRHSDGYDTDISDFKFLIDHFIDKDTPLFMLGHSMGGNIGLRFLSKYPDIFNAASFSTPLIGIKSLKHTAWLINALTPLLKPFNTSYLPGGKDWQETSRKSDGTDIFSSDPIRDSIHNHWYLEILDLQVGNPTVKWLLETLQSIKILKKEITDIKTPLLLAAAEKEELVDNDQIKKVATKIENANYIFLKNSKHEILMETDDIRDIFLNETLKLFEKSAQATLPRLKL